MNKSQLQFCIHHPEKLLTHVCMNTKECKSLTRLACDRCVFEQHSEHVGVIPLNKFAVMANTELNKQHGAVERLELLSQDSQIRKKIETKVKTLQEKVVSALQNQKEKLQELICKETYFQTSFKNMIGKLGDLNVIYSEDWMKFVVEMMVEGVSTKLEQWEREKEQLNMRVVEEIEKLECSAEKIVRLNQNPKLQNHRGSRRNNLGVEQDSVVMSFISEEKQKVGQLQQLLPYNAGTYVCGFKRLQCQDLIVSGLENSLKVFNMKTLKCTQEIKGGEEYYDIVELDNNTIAVGQWLEQQIVIFRKMVYGEWSQVRTVSMVKASASIGLYSEKLNIMVWSNGYWGIDGNACMTVDCFNEYQTKAFYTKHDVKALSLMRNQEVFLCGDKAGTIYIWNIQNNEAPLLTVESHSNYVRGIKQLKKGWVISCSDDKTIKVWNQEIHDEPLYVASLPSEPYILEICDAHNENIDELIVTAHSDGIVRFWTTDLILVGQNQLHQNAIFAMRMFDKNKFLSSSDDGVIKQWQL